MQKSVDCTSPSLRRLWHNPKISRKFVGEWKFGLQCCGPEERAHPSTLLQLFRSIIFQGTWHGLEKQQAKSNHLPWTKS